jgi:predicted dehydrogenase
MEMSLKAAIIGAGNMGKAHAKRLIKLGVEVVALCDNNPAAIQKFMDDVKPEGIILYECFDKMLEESNFDMLFICLPPFAQEGQFEKAAAKGKHIFIEKPIALSTEIGKKMVNAAVENHIITYVGFHMRKGEAVQKLVELIETGKAGKPVLFNGQYQCNSLHTPWWINVDLCGGQIFEQAIHLYDMCRYLIGNPKSVSGVMNNICHNHIRNYTVEDVSASFATFTNGAISAITANNCAIPRLWTGGFTAVFENVVAQFEDSNHANFAYTSGSEVVYETVVGENDQYFDEVEEFVQCVEQGKRSSCDIHEGYKSLNYVETVVKSAKLDGIKLAIE